MSNPRDREPDEFDLELRLAGALDDDPERTSTIDACRALGPARDEIEALGRWWAVARPPLPTAPPLISSSNHSSEEHPSLSPRSHARRPLWWRGVLATGTAAALFAAVAASVKVFPGLSGSETSAGYTARGAPAVDLARMRAGAPLAVDAPLQAGDQLEVTLVTHAPRYVTVATLQMDGSVSLLVVSQHVPAGARFEVPGRIALDGYARREWLVVLTDSDPVAPITAEDRFRALLPEPASGPDVWVTEVTRGVRVR